MTLPVIRDSSLTPFRSYVFKNDDKLSQRDTKIMKDSKNIDRLSS